MLKSIAFCAPLLVLWTVSSCIAWMRTPARRGSLQRRLRDLHGPEPQRSTDLLVDLSRRSAAYYVSLRAGSLVRGAAYAIFTACAILRPSLLIVALALALAVWVHNRWQRVANFAFFAVANDTFTGFKEAALSYQFPSHRRGKLWNLTEGSPATALSVSGLGLILVAGLPLAEQSDTLVSPIPTLYVQHSQLPFWGLSLIFLTVGCLLASAGIAVDRATKRRSMRRETTLTTRWFGAPAVFLRPFGTEELLVPAHQGPRRDGITSLLPRRNEFLEEVLTWMLWSEGEVIAVAKPNVRSGRTVGAAHHFLPQDRAWTESVAKLLRSASIVVLVPGTTPGVSWEYEQVRGSDDLRRKTLLINPEPTAADSDFLATIGAAPAQAHQLRARGLLALGAVLTPAGPTLLCSTLAEDLDYEATVDWAIRNELQPAGAPSLRLLARLAGFAGTLLKRR